MNDNAITVHTIVHKPVSRVWIYWTDPTHIIHWAFASDSWEAPSAENDVRTGGRFKTVMAAKDRSAQFDFTGTYTVVQENVRLEYDIDDGRHVIVLFEDTHDGIRITETFEPEQQNTLEMQRTGWQTILDNFKKYAEVQQ
jgi:uncharacterized protein YndB with AHSA1/START domain